MSDEAKYFLASLDRKASRRSERGAEMITKKMLACHHKDPVHKTALNGLSSMQTDHELG